MVVLNDRQYKVYFSIEVFREALIRTIAADAINCRTVESRRRFLTTSASTSATNCRFIAAYLTQRKYVLPFRRENNRERKYLLNDDRPLSTSWSWTHSS